MGEVRTEVTLVNIRDAANAQSGFIPETEIRRLTVNAVVDTGAVTLVINEETRKKLGLQVKDAGEATVAGGGKVQSQITEYVEVCWKDRNFPCKARNLRFSSSPMRKTFCWGRCPGTYGPLRGWI
jgi:hypothetical protein